MARTREVAALRPGLARALLLSLCLNLIPASTGGLIQNYDRECHLFFANHYQRAWFDPWETRWFGGFSVFSYAPLLHQLVAALSWQVGLENAYALVQIVSMLSVVVGSWSLTKALLDEEKADWAALLASVSSGAFCIAYAYGMLPTVLAFGLMLMASAHLVHYLRNGSIWELVAWTGLSGATLVAHHFTYLVCMAPLAVALAWSQRPLPSSQAGSDSETRPQLTWKRWLARTFVAALMMILNGALVMAPFWWWLLTQSQPQTEIPHFSRFNLFEKRELLWFYLSHMWGFSALLFGPAVYWGWKNRATRSYTILFVALMILGLGGRSTPLPSILFPGWWRWLTYERFAFWGAGLMIVPLGAWLSRQPNWVKSSCFLLLLLSAGRSATLTFRRPLLPPTLHPVVVAEMAHYLEKDHPGEGMYMTLGFGESNLALLTRNCQEPTWDGLYYTARRVGFLRSSGLGPLDTVTYQTEEAGNLVVNIMLRYPERFQLANVFSASERGSQWLARSGWVRVAVFGSQGTADPNQTNYRSYQVEAWRRPTRPKYVMDLQPDPCPSAFPYIWGLAPIFTLLVGILAAVGCREADQ